MCFDRVVDTNVLVTADGLQPAFSGDCLRRSVEFLNELQAGSRLVVDDGYRILGEYRANVRPGGYAEEILNAMQQRGQVAFQHITPEGPAWFQEIPPGVGFEALHDDDRHFLAVAFAHGGHPPIVNSTDPHWLAVVQPLQDHGITLQNLCHAELRNHAE